MAQLAPMPPIAIDPADLVAIGKTWTDHTKPLGQASAAKLAKLFDTAVGRSLAVMLGGIPIVRPNRNALIPPQPDCVEVGEFRVIGGVRPQNFDVGYRPDGVRFAFDSKTLNGGGSIGRNWQNMVNDLATEATTVHSRFPHAVVAFIVVYPKPAASPNQLSAAIETLERLARRAEVDGPLYMAEAIALALWDPRDGSIDPSSPDQSSPLHLERFSQQVQDSYASRYKGLPPHAAS
ncbi:MAG TPA: hypothetical protein VFW96_05670 [Thermomicrobiales bacterium]|nr:hypothetical protein [Thermomicrobiales bacterium]